VEQAGLCGGFAGGFFRPGRDFVRYGHGKPSTEECWAIFGDGTVAEGQKARIKPAQGNALGKRC
jgi:hypothetical protein